MENRQKNYGSVHDTKASMMYNRFLKQYNEADRSRIPEIRIQSIFWASSGSGWKNADFTEIHP